MEKELRDKICDRYYFVEYRHVDIEEIVTGLLLNYNSGTIDILSENGIYHIDYRDILFMKPIKEKGRVLHEDDC